jgi:hypothetical protein
VGNRPVRKSDPALAWQLGKNRARYLVWQRSGPLDEIRFAIFRKGWALEMDMVCAEDKSTQCLSELDGQFPSLMSFDDGRVHGRQKHSPHITTSERPGNEGWFGCRDTRALSSEEPGERNRAHRAPAKAEQGRDQFCFLSSSTQTIAV